MGRKVGGPSDPGSDLTTGVLPGGYHTALFAIALGPGYSVSPRVQGRPQYVAKAQLATDRHDGCRLCRHPSPGACLTGRLWEATCVPSDRSIR